MGLGTVKGGHRHTYNVTSARTKGKSLTSNAAWKPLDKSLTTRLSPDLFHAALSHSLAAFIAARSRVPQLHGIRTALECSGESHGGAEEKSLQSSSGPQLGFGNNGS